MQKTTPSRPETGLRRERLAVSPLALAVLAASSSALAATVDLPRFPALSPDGATVVFSWRGDLWRASTAGGAAVRLTANPANESRSAFTADGTRIVFESDREGTKNLWSMAADGSDLKRLTELDASFALTGVGMLDGKPVAFLETTIEGDLYRSPRPYAVSIDGGTPARVHDAFGGAAVSNASGARILFERGSSGWSRRGYNGPDNRNVWSYDPAAKTFAQLTKYDGNDGMPRFVGADEFVFVSDRSNGSMNLHRAKIGSTADSAPRLTDFDGMDIHSLAVALDGKTAVFGVLGDLWRLDLASPDAKAEKLVFTAADDGLVDREFKQVGRSVSEAALSPDGKTMAVVADGDVFVRATDDKSPTRRVTEGEARERDLCWSADGMTLYFASDRDGGDSLYAATVVETRSEARERGKVKKVETPKEATKEAMKEEPAKAEAAKEPTAGADAAKPDAAAKPEPAKPDAASEKSDAKPDAKSDKKPDAAAKKDPKMDPARWADAVRFEVKPLTTGPDNDRSPVASPDGSHLLFMRNLGDLARLDLATGDIKIVHAGWDAEMEVVFSPDGSLVALAEHDQDFNKDVWILAADGSRPAVNVTRHPDNEGSPRFSADNKILAFASERNNEEFDVWMVMLDRDLEGYSPRDLEQYFKDAAEANKKRKPLEPKAPAQPKASETADAKAGETAQPNAAETAAPAAKPGEATEVPVDATRVETGLKIEPKPAKDPFEGLELDDAYLRVRRVTTLPGDETNLELVPTGDRVVFVGSEGKDRALFSIKYDGTEQKKLGPAAELRAINFAGDRVVAIGPGGAQTIGVATGDAKTLDVSAPSEIEIARRNIQKLDEISRIMGGKFYVDPKEKGLDWPALTARYRDLASRARTAEEFDFIANMFIGHLDGSHLGVRSPDGNGPAAGPGGGASANRRAQGRLGVATVATEGGRLVQSVLANSPAALANPRLEPGDVITEIDFEAVDAGKPLEAALAGKIGQEVFVSFTRPVAKDAAPDAKPASLGAILVPVGASDERALRYSAETLANRAQVEAMSGGRIGYLHIQSMDQASLDRFERDLYAAAAGREALLVDVRNNGGGFTADRLLSSIDVRPHASAIPREGDRSRPSYPQDRLFIQRYTMPMAMLCNEKSFSNAEIISHAFKTLGRGPLVGQQTAGGVISTGAETLVDGTTVRMPFRGWYLPDGRDMEENGAMPDFVVMQTPEDESRGHDAQLAKAVDELMRKLPKK